MNGILILDKPERITSQTAVTKTRKLFGTKKIGHAGTLDPMATGVLPLLLGQATKACELLMDHEKTYLASFVPGVETDTEDIFGTVIRKYEGVLPSFEEFKTAAESFRGEIKQVPPMYSALKSDGMKLVDLARKGIEIEREARTVTIREIVPYVDETDGRWMLSVRCSRGTYIRTLCADIGKKLCVGGCMGSLRRTSVGQFHVEDACTFGQLEQMSMEEREQKLIPLWDVFSDCPVVTLPSFHYTLYANGEKILLSKLPSSVSSVVLENTLVRVKAPGEDGGSPRLHSLARAIQTDEGLKFASAVRFM